MRFSIGFTIIVLISLKASPIGAESDLLCTSRCSAIDLAFVDALALPSECQVTDENEEILEPFSVCSVEYRINYLRERVHVTFSGSNETENLHTHHGHQSLEQTVQLSLYSHFDDVDGLTRKYQCNTKKDCARDFYLNTIGPLLADGRTKLTQIKNKLYNSSLLTGPGSKRRCIDSDKTGPKPSARCPYGLCYAHLARHHHHNESKTQKCHENERAALLSKNEYHLADGTTHTQNEMLEYRCNKNVCNRNDMIEIIHGLLNDFSHLNTTKRTSPHSMTDGKQNDQDIQTKKSCSTSIQSSLLLVLFYMLLQHCF